MTLLNGSEPRIYYGILGAYGSVSKAQDVGMEWVHKQLRDRLDRYSPFLATEKDKDEAFEDWPKYESEQRGLWSYTISKGDETLVVRAHNITMDDTWHDIWHVPKSTDDGEGRMRAGEGRQEMKGRNE